LLSLGSGQIQGRLRRVAGWIYAQHAPSSEIKASARVLSRAAGLGAANPVNGSDGWEAEISLARFLWRTAM